MSYLKIVTKSWQQKVGNETFKRYIISINILPVDLFILLAEKLDREFEKLDSKLSRSTK